MQVPKRSHSVDRSPLLPALPTLTVTTPMPARNALTGQPMTHQALQDLLERIDLFDAVVWDFDGVLSETEALHQESYRQVGLLRDFAPEGDWYTPLIGHTANENWMTLMSCGLRAKVSEISALEAERERVFSSLIGTGLRLSSLGAVLIPAFAAKEKRQEIVSNGDLSLIQDSVRAWGLEDALHVVPRRPASDKQALLEARVRPGIVTFDDTDRYLRVAEKAGALAVGVRHSHNRHCVLTDLVVDIEGS